jgi:hypothetical protein
MDNADDIDTSLLENIINCKRCNGLLTLLVSFSNGAISITITNDFWTGMIKEITFIFQDYHLNL